MSQHPPLATNNIPTELYSAIVDISHDAIIAVDQTQNIILFNQGAKQIFGYNDAAEVIGQPLDMLLPAELANIHRAHVRNFAESDSSARMMGERRKISGRRKDGTIFPAEASIARVSVGEQTIFTVILRDITERLRAEETSRRYLQRITDQAPFALVEYQIAPDGAMSIPFISNGIANIHPGLTAEMFMQNPDLGFSTMHPDDVKRVRTSFRTSAERLTNWDEEFRVATDDGIRWHRGHAKPEKQADGTITWYGFLEDITGRKRAEKALQESEEYFRLMFEQNPYPMWVFDLETLQFLEINEAAITQYGYTRDEFLQMRLPDIRPVEDVPRMLEEIEHDPPASHYSGEWPHRLKDGQIIDVEISSHTLEFAGRKAALVLAQNITERKQSEQALKESEDRYRTLFASVPIGLGIADMQGNVLVYNQAMASLNRFSGKDESQPINISGLYVDVQARESLLVRLQKQGFVERLETQLRRFDGTTYDALMSVRLITWANKPATLAAIEDITARKQAQEALRESEERYRLVSHASSDYVFSATIAPDGNPRDDWIGGAIETILGYSPEEFIARGGWRTVLHPDDVIKDDQARAAMHANRPVTNEVRVFRKDGKEIWVQVNATPVWDTAQNRLAGVTGGVRDITERKQAEERLRIAESRYRSLVEQVPGIVYAAALDESLSTLYTSPQIELLLGWTADEWQADPELWINSVHPDDRPQILDTIQRSSAEGAPVSIEYRIATKTGEFKWMSDEARMVQNEQGGMYWQGLMTDITTRKQAEETLRESEERYRSTLESMMEGCQIISYDWRYLFLNDAAAAQGKQQKEALLGRTMMECYPGIENTDLFAALQHCMQERVSHQLLNEFEYPDGTKGWFDVIVQPAPDGIFILSSDITERKEAQMALERQLARTGLLNEIARATATRLDLVSVFQVALGQLEEQLPLDFSLAALYDPDNGAITFTACGLKSYTRNAQLGFTPGRFIPLAELGLQEWLNSEDPRYYPNLAQLEPAFAHQLVEGGLGSLMVLPLLVADAEPLGLLMVGRSQNNAFTPREQEFLGQVGKHITLTAQHARLYEQLQTAYNDLRQTQEALLKEERLSALGQMASGIAHDINNALVPIIGFTEIILMRETYLSPQVRQDLDRIKIAGEDITHIVNRMKQFYRPREAQETLLPVDLNQIVPQVIDLTRPQWRDIPQQQAIFINVETDLADDLPPVQGIESELREALTNLVINAVHAMPQGGTLTIRTCQSDQQLILEVSDTGTGMDEKTRKRCLEPFYTTKGQQGTGLGLSMVYGVMQRHDGAIEIESTLGRGTTIRLHFPLRVWVPSQESPTSDQEIMLPVLRILCVDDDPRVRELLFDLFTNEGHKPTLADGGQAGIDAFRESLAQGQPFDLVITDLGMPHVGGREVARAIKRISPQTPIILLSGWGRQLEGSGQTPGSVDIVLGKPPTLSQLRIALAKAFIKPGKEEV
ncbi:MAG: Sensor histidine kinase RcsC [Anaerolineae bacterium]|nr:Sensor histidine kinase RcsC [Anaerolineae bacterium]